MKTVFIWENVVLLTFSYHSGGGLVIVADNLDAARELAKQCDAIPNGTNEYYGDNPGMSEIFTSPPNHTYPTGDTEDRVIVFADRGCC